MEEENVKIIENTTKPEDAGFEKFKQLFKIIDFSDLSKIKIIDELKKENILFSKYTKEEVVGFLSNPQKNEKQIRKVSIYLYNNSTQYRRLCNYFSKLCTLNYTIFPYNLKPKYNKVSFKSNYNKVVNELEKLNLKFHLDTIFNICLYQDMFCGLYYGTEDSFDIIEVNPDFTRISRKEDGCLMFEIDFEYFKTRQYLLENDDELKAMYVAYAGGTIKKSDSTEEKIKGDKKLQWQMPENQICLKINSDQLMYATPPFAGVFPEIMNLEDYKLLKMQQEILKSYKIIAMEIPLNDDGSPKLDEGVAKKFYDQACANIDSSIGIVLTPMKMTKMDFNNTQASESNSINDAESSFWASTGTHGGLIGWGEKQSASTVKLSVNNDESIMYSLLRQVEKWVNKYIKDMKLPFDFKVSFLNQTIYNAKDVADKYEKAATHGVPGSRLLYAASVDLSPSDLICGEALENELDMIDNWIPLKSSNTMSSDDVGGRPVQDDVDDAGEQTREDDTNENR